MLAHAHRRTLANLSIPMNPIEISGRMAGFYDATPEQVDKLLRGELSKRGWVAKVTGDDAVQIASVAQKHKDAIEVTDERAEIYARRMSSGRFRWRTFGDLWILTNEGLAAIQAPLVDPATGEEPPPKTPSEVQALVDQEWARTLKEDYVPDKHSLASMLLLHEFNTWFDAVSAECERIWNVKLHKPIAGGVSGYTDAYEISLLDAENQKTALGAVVDPWYMALSLLSFNDTDTGTTADAGGHIPTYTGYARKSVAGADMAAGSGTSGSVSNVNAITFAACTAGTSAIVAFANCVASTVGVMRKYGDCTSVTVSTTQTPPQFAVGAYTTTTA